MPGWVKAQGYAMVQQAFAVRQGLQVDVLAQAAAQDADAWGGGEVVAVADAGMVAVAVGDDGTFHWPPGIDVKITWRTVQAFGAGDDEVHGMGAGLELPVRNHGRGGKFDWEWLGHKVAPTQMLLLTSRVPTSNAGCHMPARSSAVAVAGS